MLVRLGSAGLAAAGIAGGALWLNGRPRYWDRAPGTVVPSFAVDLEAGLPRMVIGRGPDPAVLVRAILEEMGGIGRFIAKGDRVLVKPNAAFDRPVWQAATTNPVVLGTVVSECRKAGAAEIVVTDNPIHAPEGCFRKTGIAKAAEDAGGRVVLPDPRAFRPVSLPGTILDGWKMHLGPLDGMTKVIGIAPVKDHNLALASMTMKNWYGMLGGPRNLLHQRLDEAIADLGLMMRPTLSILDGTRILFRNGPTGGSPEDVKVGDVIAASVDGVALDAFGATLLDLDPSDLAYLALAEERGVGTADYSALSPKEIAG
jgi:uncharacterized protein (DUF362 family)